jgi:hypothetical protein
VETWGGIREALRLRACRGTTNEKEKDWKSLYYFVVNILETCTYMTALYNWCRTPAMLCISIVPRPFD